MSPSGAPPSETSSAARGMPSATVEERIAQARARSRRHRRRDWIIAGVVAVAVAATALAFVLWPSEEVVLGEADAPVPADVASSSESTATVTDDYGVLFGDVDAAHRVVIYEDFLCPHCGELERTLSDDLEQLIESGDIAVEFRVFNLLNGAEDYSLRAANAFAVVLATAGADAAWSFHASVFAEQPSSEDAAEAWDDDWLVERAEQAGADPEAVRDGLDAGTYEDWVREAAASAESNDVSTTPTVLVDDEQLDGDADELAEETLERVA